MGRHVDGDGADRLSAAPRLHPAHYEPARVPPEVARFGDGGGALAVGSPGKVGLLELAFEVRGCGEAARTQLVHHYQKAPLQIMRPLYFDDAWPQMPFTYLITTGGGVLHGDRLRMDLTFGPGTAAHVTTQAHTKLYRMDGGYATASAHLSVGAGAFVEYLPDPLIPYAAARFAQRTVVTLDPTATFVTGETIHAGRLSRGERHAYDALAVDLDVVDPSGRPLVIDRTRLAGGSGDGDGDAHRVAVLGRHDVVATLYVVTPRIAAASIADAVHEATVSTATGTTRTGVSVLPHDVGAWVRIVGDDTDNVAATRHAGWSAARLLLTGRPAPLVRK
ncbi:MAG: urease accessory protein UreD [Ilumatobacteraceae bacterium]